MATNNIAAAYIRVSTKEQAEKKNSIQEQTNLAKDYAKKNGLILDDSMIFQEAQSASKCLSHANLDSSLEKSLSSRTELKKLLSLVSNKEISHFIVYSRDRLARSVDDFMSISKSLKDHNVQLRYSRPGEYHDDNEKNIYNKFLEIVLASIAEFEINALSTRVTSGCKTNIQEGHWAGGKIPFGYIPIKKHNKKTTLVAPVLEKEIVQDIFKYYNQYGYSYRKIATLIEQKYGTKRFDIKWTKGTIQTILSNEIYIGHLIWNRRGGRRNPGKKKETEYIRSNTLLDDIKIIDNDTWQSTCDLRKMRFQLKDSKYFNTPYLLKDKLYCGKCHTLIKTKNYGKTKKSAYRCIDSIMKNDQSELILEVNAVHQAFFKEFKNILNLNTSHLNKLWETYQEKIAIKIKNIESIKESLKKKLSELRIYKNSLEEFYPKFVIENKDANTEDESTQKQSSTKKTDTYSTPPKTISSTMQDKIIELSKEIDYYNHEIKNKDAELERIQATPLNRKENFIEHLKDLTNNFDKLDTGIQRMLIHILVDKVTINEVDHKISLDIVMNTPSLN
ncbi:MAG: recombinase family protein [Marinisporobacter sp.]|jgi:DNA invertase Pin-like site-specific DNA recombinase|nr:recombinase family protein [Marinisporobacter sp.]